MTVIFELNYKKNDTCVVFDGDSEHDGLSPVRALPVLGRALKDHFDVKYDVESIYGGYKTEFPLF